MVVCGFVFDVIVPSIKIDGEFNPETLNVLAKFDKGETKLTKSRINVSEFPDGKGIEFDTNTDTVRAEFDGFSIVFSVRDGGKDIGSATIDWPEEVIQKLQQMSECILYASVYLQPEEDGEEGEPVGTMEVMVRFSPKCKNLLAEDFGEDFEEIKDEVLGTIGSKDLFFIVSPDTHLEACGGELEYHKELPELSMTLDVSKFVDYNGQLVPTPSILNTCCNPDSCGLKKESKKYGAKDKTCGAMKMLSRGRKKDPKDSCLICGNNEPSDSGSIIVNQDEDEIRNLIWTDPKPVKPCLSTPPPELKINHPIHPRSCPVCETNVDWLPPYTPCPKCGYKAVPHIRELPYSHEIKAAEVLRDFYFREASSDPIDCRAAVHRQGDDDDDDDDDIVCERCKNSRVRSACKNLFKAKFDLCKAKKKVPLPPQYSKPLQQVFCNLKNLLDNVDLLQTCDERAKCSNILHDHEEKQIKHNILGDARYEPCKELQRIKTRMSRCIPLDPDACNRKTKKKKKVTRKQCHCGSGKNLKDDFHKNVPSNKGWLWNLDPHSNAGWKPGAVRRTVRNIMTFFLQTPSSNAFGERLHCRYAPPPEKPLLHVCKRNDVVFVTLRPGCDCKANPMRFAIEKSDEAKKLRKLRDKILDRGFDMCSCSKPISECCCRDELELAKLLCCVMKEACTLGLYDAEEKLILNDECDSEAEYEFAINPPPKVCQRRKKYDTNGVLFNARDNMKPKAPSAGMKPEGPSAGCV